jgi:hypothetical protein
MSSYRRFINGYFYLSLSSVITSFVSSFFHSSGYNLSIRFIHSDELLCNWNHKITFVMHYICFTTIGIHDDDDDDEHIDGMRLRLWTATTNGRIVHPQGELYKHGEPWWCQLRKTPNSNSYQQNNLVANREDAGEGNYLFCLWNNYLIHVEFLTYGKILRHGASGFTAPPKEGVLPIFIALKSRSSRPGLNTRTFSLVASTLTIIPPRRRLYTYFRCFLLYVFQLSCNLEIRSSDILLRTFSQWARSFDANYQKKIS